MRALCFLVVGFVQLKLPWFVWDCLAPLLGVWVVIGGLNLWCLLGIKNNFRKGVAKVGNGLL